MLRIVRQFDKLDVDGDGKIECNELHHLLSNNLVHIGLNERQVSTLLVDAERRRNEFLDFVDFSLLVTSAKAQKSTRKRIFYALADSVISKSERPHIHTYIDEYSFSPIPLFIPLISIAQIVIFVWYMMECSKNEDILTYCAGCWASASVGPFLFAPLLRHQAWRFFTYQFLHQGLLHLLPNIATQLLVGIPLELVHKFWRIGPIYTLAVILGALLQYTLDPSVHLIGCSAGVYALVTAHLSNVIINWADMPYRYIRVGLIALYFAFDVASAAYRRLQQNACDRVAYTAHIAGAITGLLMGIVLLRNLEVLSWEKYLISTCMVTYILMVVLVVTMVIFVEPFSTPIWDSMVCTSMKIDS